MQLEKATKAHSEELIFAQYGIDVETLQVKSVWQRSEMECSGWGATAIS